MAADPLLDALARIVGAAHVLTAPEVCAPYTTDWTRRFSGRARAVVRPADTAEVAGVLAACADHDAAVVAQGGNTGLVGGGVPRGGEVVLSLARLDELGPVDTLTRQVTVGAGARLAAVQAHAAAAGLAYGVDLAARDSATIGGTVATDAGGLNVVANGSTRRQVAGLELVLADGTVIDRLAGLEKDTAGYDLAGLVVGSEGTLAVVTRVRLRLVAPRPDRVVAVVALADVPAALELLGPLRGLAPALTAVELMLGPGLARVLAHTGERSPFAELPPVAVLVEVGAERDPTEQLAAVLGAAPGVLDVAVGTDPHGRARLWALREAHAEALAAAGIPVKLDVAVPLGELAAVLDTLPAVVAAAAHDAELVVFGHLAEGNLHVNVLGPPPGSAAAEQLEAAVLGLVTDHGGSISAEHGLGVAKTRYLPLMRTAADRGAMAAVKRALDPQGRLNPGVVVP